jgi:hypothetical protein
METKMVGVIKAYGRDSVILDWVVRGVTKMSHWEKGKRITRKIKAEALFH